MERDKLIENMMTFFPLLHKKLVKRWPEGGGLSKLQFQLLFAILREDGKPMSYYSDRMMISRPNLTGLSDKLIEEGLVERAHDLSDRRIIILKLTEKGKDYIHQHRRIVKEKMVMMLDSLEEEDVIRLNQLIDEMKEILGKVL